MIPEQMQQADQVNREKICPVGMSVLGQLRYKVKARALARDPISAYPPPITGIFSSTHRKEEKEKTDLPLIANQKKSLMV